MTGDDIGYYRQRAEIELELAQRATKPEVVKAHFLLADAYLERVAATEPPRQVEHA